MPGGPVTAAPRPEDELDRLFAPAWAGGWAATRLLFVVAAALAHAPRAAGIGDAYGAADLALNRGIYRLPEWMIVTPTHCWVAWAVGLAGLAMVAWGGRALHVGLLAWFAGSWFLLADEAINVKAYDRLLTWIALALLLSPAWRRGLVRTWAHPTARLLLLIVFCAIYGSTGFAKLLHEPSWIGSGEVLQHHLLATTFGLKPLGVLLSGSPWLVAPMAWTTVAFEVLFPFLIWIRRTNPWVLAVGAAFHLGLMALLDVGPFGLVSLAAYPVLLHPEVARGLWERATARWSRLAAR